jgi:hypothetical protein
LVKLFGDNTVQQKALSGVALVLSRTPSTHNNTSNPVRPRDMTKGQTPLAVSEVMSTAATSSRHQQQPKTCRISEMQAQQQQHQM